jgi:hypothetical protein
MVDQRFSGRSAGIRVEGNVLTIGTKDAGNPTTVGRWRRQAP